MLSTTTFANWTKVDESAIGNHYVDFDKIRTQNGFVYFWTLLDLLKPDPDGDLSYKNYKQGDCKLFRFKSLSFSFHKEPMGDGAGETGSPENPEWNYPSPNSGDKMTLKLVCGR
jgi:hypothetical protein